MTATDTASGSTAQPQSDETQPQRKEWMRLPRTELGKYISRRASALQQSYLNDSSVARANLAELRRSVGRSAGADPVTWGIVFDGFPRRLMGVDDAPSPSEVAAYAALGLLAIHLQSATRPVHLPGVGLGAAVRLLASPSDGADREKAVMRRFQSLGTADVLEEVLHHARGLVQQFRHPPGGAAPIGLDYGLLAEDLVDLQDPAHRDAVRLRWARDLYRSRPASDTTENNSEE